MVDDGGFFLAPRLNKSKNRFNGAGRTGSGVY